MNASQVSTSTRKRIAALGECMIEIQGQPFGATRQGFGGDTLNTAVYLARCGGTDVEVHYATALGDDSLSAGLLARWAAEGIHLDLVHRMPGRIPGMYQIEVDASGERRFHYWRGQSAARSYFDCTRTALEAQAESLDALYLSGISLAILVDEGRERVLSMMNRMRDRGAMVAFDNNYRPRLWRDAQDARLWFGRAFASCSLALVTAEDQQALHDFQDLDGAVAASQRLPSPEIAIKRGALSTLVREDGEWTEVPVIDVPAVVDTTAAGDSFAAGYVGRRLGGEGPVAAASFGNRLAARVIQYPGALVPRHAMGDLMYPVSITD